MIVYQFFIKYKRRLNYKLGALNQLLFFIIALYL